MIKKIKSFLFENKSTRQTVAKNTFWLFFGEISSRVLRGAIVIYAARVLGADGWGVFSYAITFAALFTIFSDLGLGAILTRESAKNPELRPQYLSTSLFIKLSLVGISVVLIIFAAPLFTKIPSAKTLLPIVALILVFDGLREFGFSLNRAMEKMESEAFTKTVTNLLITALGFLFLMTSKTAESLAWSYTIGSAVGFLIMIWTLRKYFTNLVSNFSKKLLWPIFSAAWPFTLMGILGAIMLNTDTIMLGWYKTAEELGFYSAAQRPIQLIYILPSLIGTAVFPSFARLAKRDNEKFRQILEKSIGMVLMVGLPIILGGLIVGKDLMLLVFGNEYLPAVTTFKILLITILFVFPGAFLGNAIFAYDAQKKFIGFLAIGALGNILFNYLLIPRFGIEGSAIATVAAQLLANGFGWYNMKKINNFCIMPHLKKTFAATILMSIFTYIFYMLKISVFINLPLSVIIYFAVLYLLKEPFLAEVKSIFRY